jgi:hypothetical protein
MKKRITIDELIKTDLSNEIRLKTINSLSKDELCALLQRLKKHSERNIHSDIQEIILFIEKE